MRKKIPALIAGICLILLTGCGGNQALDTFHDDMDTFYDSLSAAVNVLENIDPDSDTAVDDMLSQLDNMSSLFDTLAAMETPEPFENIEEIADEAAEYMSEASTLYHEAYADGNYDVYIAEAAAENYSRAMKRINYIAVLLQGRYPDDENVIIVPESNEPDWNGGESPDMTEP